MLQKISTKEITTDTARLYLKLVDKNWNSVLYSCLILAGDQIRVFDCISLPSV